MDQFQRRRPRQGLCKGDGPTFRYSIGFTKTLNAPEIIIFGLPLGMMHDMLWKMFRQMQDGARLDDVSPNVATRFG